MSKARTAVKYTAASATTVLYAAAIYNALTKMEPKPVAPHRVAIVAAGMAATTWIATLA